MCAVNIFAINIGFPSRVLGVVTLARGHKKGLTTYMCVSPKGCFCLSLRYMINLIVDPPTKKRKRAKVRIMGKWGIRTTQKEPWRLIIGLTWLPRKAVKLFMMPPNYLAYIYGHLLLLSSAKKKRTANLRIKNFLGRLKTTSISFSFPQEIQSHIMSSFSFGWNDRLASEWGDQSNHRTKKENWPFSIIILSSGRFRHVMKEKKRKSDSKIFFENYA